MVALFDLSKTYVSPNEQDQIKQNSTIRQIIEWGNTSGPWGIPVESYGAAGDGVTDDSAKIQAAINAVVARGGGNVILGPRTYAVASSLDITKSHVQLIGSGGDEDHTAGVGSDFATRLLWTGGSGSTNAAVIVETTAGSTHHIVNSGVRNLQIDGGGKAGYGLQVVSVNGGHFENLSIIGCATDAYHLNTLNTNQITGDFGDIQECRFIRCTFHSSGSVNGFYLTGASSTFAGNVSFNHFENCTGEVVNGGGYVLDNADNNRFMGCHGFVNGSGNLFDCHGTSSVSVGGDCNYFIGCSWPSFTIRGTTDGYAGGVNNNWIVCFDVANGSPFPTVNTGSQFIGPIGGFTSAYGSGIPAWTPTVSASSGTITSTQYTVNSAQWRYEGKNVFFEVSVTVSSGTGSNTLLITQPPYSTSNSGNHFGTNNVFPALNTTQGTAVWGRIFDGTHFALKTYNNQFPITSLGDTIEMSGWYNLD